MSPDPRRRQFLRSCAGIPPQAPRPPWALAEGEFLRSCDRCAACVQACPEGILLRGHDGLPQLAFQRGECTFCGECAAACPTGTLRRTGAPWMATPGIEPGCLALNGVICRVCAEHCDQGAIRFRLVAGGHALPELELAACNGCGACVAPCPVQAMSVQVEPVPQLSEEAES